MFVLTALVAAHATTVDVIGVGPVPIEEATAACLDEASIGTEDPRTSVFETVARDLLSAPEADRSDYFGLPPGEPWPTHSIQLEYPHALTFVPRGRIAACAAVGRHWVAVGAELRAPCVEKKSTCKE